MGDARRPPGEGLAAGGLVAEEAGPVPGRALGRHRVDQRRRGLDVDDPGGAQIGGRLEVLDRDSVASSNSSTSPAPRSPSPSGSSSAWRHHRRSRRASGCACRAACWDNPSRVSSSNPALPAPVPPPPVPSPPEALIPPPPAWAEAATRQPPERPPGPPAARSAFGCRVPANRRGRRSSISLSDADGVSCRARAERGGATRPRPAIRPCSEGIPLGWVPRSPRYVAGIKRCRTLSERLAPGLHFMNGP